MGRITTGVGLISGINTAEVINQLMALEERPKLLLQTRIDDANRQKLAYTDLRTRLTSLRLVATTLKKPSSFTNATAASSNANVLTATAGQGAAVGAYQFRVARLVSAQQTISRGFADFDKTAVGAGTLTVELGGGDLTEPAKLADLNGGAGVRRGSFRLTDRSGNAASIDIGSAVTLDDVLRQINTNLDVRVRASLDGDRIVLSDESGGAGTLRVEDLSGGSAAADLGIAGSSGSATLAGTDINYLSRDTLLSRLNDGRGLRLASSGPDLQIDTTDGGSFSVSLASARTLGEALDLINAAGAGSVQAELVSGGNGIRVVDITGGGTNPLEISSLNGSQAARDLGIEAIDAGGTIAGRDILAEAGSVLLSSLRGGQGLSAGTISIQSRSAGSATNIDLSAAQSVQEMIDLINGAGAGVTASLNASRNGIAIVDTTGGSGDLVIGDVSGTTAAQLGVAGTFGASVAEVRGANLQRQWITSNTLLSDFNAGRGVTRGTFRITDASGASAIVDLTQGNEVRLGDVIAEINSRGIGVAASINENGDGLLITDTSGGAGQLTIEDVSGATASDLNIAGVAAGTTINGSFEKTIAISATDKLADVEKKINDLGWGLNASIINDGTGATPYRLSLNARNAGRAGRVVFDAGATALATRNLVDAQDAAVFFGGGNPADAVLITASRNQLAGVISGVTIDLVGASDQPVTINISRSADNVVEQMNTFTSTFNELVDRLTELTQFDAETNARGLLLGESTAQGVQSEIYAMLNTTVAGAGRYRTFSDIGLRVVEGAKLAFDEDKFRAAYATDPQAVERLFTLTESTTQQVGAAQVTTTTPRGLAAIAEQRINRLIDPIDGTISRQNAALDTRTADFERRITQLDRLLTTKRGRLERQFASLETVLAGLQSQQQALSQIQITRFSTSSGR